MWEFLNFFLLCKSLKFLFSNFFDLLTKAAKTEKDQKHKNVKKKEMGRIGGNEED